MELYVKKQKSAVYIRNIKKYPELEIKLLEKIKSIWLPRKLSGQKVPAADRGREIPGGPTI